MLPPAVVEQQAKLGVSAEESKFERTKRQQARFRDRGGAFVPSTSNPLVDILLARTVSGESPSKAHRKDVTPKRVSPVKARQTSARKAGVASTSDKGRAVAGTGKPAVSQKRKKKAPELGDDTTEKQRGGKQTKGKKKVPDAFLGTERPPSSAKSKSTLKGRGKQRDTGAASSSSGSSVKPKPKSKAKSNSAKTVVDVPVSDDDQTLADAHSGIKYDIRQNGNDGEMDGEASIVRKSALPSIHGAKNMVRIKEENITDKGNSGKKMEDMSHRKRKDGADPHQSTSEPVEDDERPAAYSSKPRKRKKEDNHDDRPRKSVKFSDTSLPYSSSRDLKENQSDKIHETIIKTRFKDDPDVPCLKLAVKLPSRAKRSKGPPREVLERIKAGVERHLHCADSDPDELDCLS